METSAYYLQKVKALFNIPPGSYEISISYKWDTPTEAKAILANLRITQKELRLIKSEINTTIKEIKLGYMGQKENAGSSGVLLSILGKKQLAARSRSIALDQIRRREQSEIAPYQKVIQLIDKINLQIDRIKLQIQSNINEPKIGE
jgi:hypothetical protein